nr:hypothetical protein [Angustibacter aerolatus]
MSPSPLDALVAEAASKSGLLWVRPAGSARAWPAWHVWLDGSAYVVSGPGEQRLPELRGDVELVLRSKDSGARLLTVPATAEPLSPADEGWGPATTALAASRLNAPVEPAALPARWQAAGDVVTRLHPAADPTEAPGAYLDDSGAAAPAPTDATTSGLRPRHLGGRRRRRARGRG